MDGRRTHGRTDAQKIMLLVHTFIMKGSDVANLVELRLVVLEEIAWRTDGHTDEGLKIKKKRGDNKN